MVFHYGKYFMYIISYPILPILSSGLGAKNQRKEAKDEPSLLQTILYAFNS